MDNFILNLIGELDKNSTKTDIENKLNDISKELNLEIGNISIDTSKITSEVSKLKTDINKSVGEIGNSTVKSTKEINNLVHTFQTGIDKVTKTRYEDILKSLGLDNESITKATDKIDEMELALKSVSTTVRKNSKNNNERIIDVSIVGTDNAGRAVSLIQTFNARQKDVSTSTLRITENYDNQNKEILKSNKELDKQKSIVAAITRTLDETKAKYSDRKNPLIGIEVDTDNSDESQTVLKCTEEASGYAEKYAESFNAAYEKAVSITNELNNGNQVSQEEINNLNKLVSTAKIAGENAKSKQTTSTSFRTKDIDSQIVVEQQKLRELEAEMQKCGATLQSVLENTDIKITNTEGEAITLNDKLSEVGQDSNKLAEYLNLVDQVRAAFKAWKAEQSASYSEKNFIDTELEKLSQLESKIKSINGNTEIVDKLFDKLNNIKSASDKNSYQTEYNTINDNINKQIAENNRQEKESNALLQEQITVRKQILDIELQLSKLNAEGKYDGEEATLLKENEERLIKKSNLLKAQADQYKLIISEAEREKIISEAVFEEQNKINTFLAKNADRIDKISNVEGSKYSSQVESILNNATDNKSSSIKESSTLNLLNQAYNNAIKAIDTFRNSTAETYSENKKVAEEAIEEFRTYVNILQDGEKSISSVGNQLDKLESFSGQSIFSKNGNEQSVKDLQNSVSNLRVEWNELQKEFTNEGATPEVVSKFKELAEQIQNTSNRATDLKTSLTATADASKLSSDKKIFTSQMQTWLTNNTKAGQELRAKIYEIIQAVETADRATLDKLKKEFRTTTQYAVETGQAGKSLGDTFKEKFAKFTGWFSMSQVIMGSIQKLKEMEQNVVNIDTAMTNLKKVTDETDTGYQNFLDNATSKAKELGASITDLIDSTSEFARLGYNLDDAATLGEVASLYKNVGDGITADEASESIISTMKAYNIQAKDAESIIDKFNKVGGISPLYTVMCG